MECRRSRWFPTLLDRWCCTEGRFAVNAITQLAEISPSVVMQDRESKEMYLAGSMCEKSPQMILLCTDGQLKCEQTGFWCGDWLLAKTKNIQPEKTLRQVSFNGKLRNNIWSLRFQSNRFLHEAHRVLEHDYFFHLSFMILSYILWNKEKKSFVAANDLGICQCCTKVAHASLILN